MLDFTNFGELSEIIKANWDVFGGMLSSKKAVETAMARLNSIRGPIAHRSPLAEDEIVRLKLTVRDWFRLMDRARVGYVRQIGCRITGDRSCSAVDTRSQPRSSR
jgi:hypothetical protein